jgi:hypothetical protein
MSWRNSNGTFGAGGTRQAIDPSRRCHPSPGQQFSTTPGHQCDAIVLRRFGDGADTAPYRWFANSGRKPIQDNANIGHPNSGKPIDIQILFWFCRDRHLKNKVLLWLPFRPSWGHLAYRCADGCSFFIPALACASRFAQAGDDRPRGYRATPCGRRSSRRSLLALRPWLHYSRRASQRPCEVRALSRARPQRDTLCGIRCRMIPCLADARSHRQ